MKSKLNLSQAKMIFAIIALFNAFSSSANTDNCECADASAQYKIWYLDSDGDGFGDMLNARIGCTQPFRYVDNCLDEDDTKSNNVVSAGVATIQEWFRDADGDGFGDPMTAYISAFIPDGYVSDSSDADDTNEMIWFSGEDSSVAMDEPQRD